MTSLLQKLYRLHPLYLVSLIACVIALSYLTAVLKNKKSTMEYIIDYTKCSNENDIMCKNFIGNGTNTCVCYIKFTLTENFCDKIVAYYELESFDQLEDDYVNSKDDSQLRGVLNAIPSENCEPYRYDENRKPIAPCGRIAHTLFNDTFNILQTSTNKYVPYLLSGMLDDLQRKQFRNPDNISEAKLNFAKPKNWNKSIWEFDTNNSENNGFQNEFFIGWMNTKLKRKPRARFTQELPNGTYLLRVGYNYPPSIYDGPRKFIISSIKREDHRNAVIDWIWIISLVMIFVYLFICLVIYVKYKIKRRKKPSNQGENENMF